MTRTHGEIKDRDRIKKRYAKRNGKYIEINVKKIKSLEKASDYVLINIEEHPI